MKQPKRERLFRLTCNENNERDKSIIEFLEQQNNMNETIKEILTKWIKGELVTNETLELQIKKLKADIRIKEATATIKEFEANHIEVFNKTPSHAAMHAKRTSLGLERPISCIDEKNSRFYCPNCTEVFNWKNNPLTSCKEGFIDHWYKSHKGDPSEEFLYQLGELK